MNSKQIEIEGMKELLKENELEIGRLRKDIKNLKEERDFFKEQATLWRNDYKNEYEENKKLKEDKKIRALNDRDNLIQIEKLEEENKKLKADYIKLSKIVETTGGYKSSYVNELRDKIAKLEFDIEARIKLKAVREDKERILNEEIRGLRDKKYSHGEPVVSSGAIGGQTYIL